MFIILLAVLFGLLVGWAVYSYYAQVSTYLYMTVLTLYNLTAAFLSTYLLIFLRTLYNLTALMLTWLVNIILAPLKMGFELIPTLFGWILIVSSKFASLAWYLINLIGLCA